MQINNQKDFAKDNAYALKKQPESDNIIDIKRRSDNCSNKRLSLYFFRKLKETATGIIKLGQTKTDEL